MDPDVVTKVNCGSVEAFVEDFLSFTCNIGEIVLLVKCSTCLYSSVVSSIVFS